MLFKIAKVFSSGTEYEVFKDNYCENGCIFHKERESDGFPEFTDYGGCPIEDRCESARFNEEAFPNVLLEVWEEGKCLNWHHCPFYVDGSNEPQIGKWLYESGYNTCSVCRNEVAEYDDSGRKQSFERCPHCGSIMREGDENDADGKAD